jgi:hypothetical protein
MAMKIVEIGRQPDPPQAVDAFNGGVNFSLYVDFLLALLLRNGPGVLEAEPRPGEDPVEWRHRSFVGERGLIQHWVETEPVVVHKMPRGIFRPVLARLGYRLTDGAEVFAGSGLFKIRFIDEPREREFIFHIYLANDRGVGTWARLYWCGPDMEYPRADEPAAATTTTKKTASTASAG